MANADEVATATRATNALFAKSSIVFIWHAVIPRRVCFWRTVDGFRSTVPTAEVSSFNMADVWCTRCA